jgi:hypothetical protein
MLDLLSRYQWHDDAVRAWEPLSWRQAESWTRVLPAKTNLIVPRENLDAAPPFDESWMGRRRGALRQYRCKRRFGNLHIKEFPDHWVMHIDSWNPHKAPVRHLAIDHGFKHFLHLWDLVTHNPFEVPVPVRQVA